MYITVWCSNHNSSAVVLPTSTCGRFSCLGMGFFPVSQQSLSTSPILGRFCGENCSNFLINVIHSVEKSKDLKSFCYFVDRDHSIKNR